MVLFEALSNCGRLIVFITRTNTNLDIGIIIIVPSAFIIMAQALVNAAPESPYWCVYNGRMQEAFQSLYFSRKVKVMAARDLWQIYLADVHAMHRGSSQYPSSVFQLTTLAANPQLRRAIVAVAAIILSRNLSAYEVARGHLYDYAMGEVSRLLDTSFRVRTLVLSFIGIFLPYITFAYMAICGRWLDRFGRRPFLMGLTLFMFLLIQAPGIEPTGNQALSLRICSVIALCFYVVSYQTTDMLHTVYTSEVFLTRYNGMALR
jgi:hypothetical protein